MIKLNRFYKLKNQIEKKIQKNKLNLNNKLEKKN